MTNDDWVADVRRWVNTNGVGSVATQRATRAVEERGGLDVEAARPALQARHRPDALVESVSEPG